MDMLHEVDFFILYQPSGQANTVHMDPEFQEQKQK